MFIKCQKEMPMTVVELCVCTHTHTYTHTHSFSHKRTHSRKYQVPPEILESIEELIETLELLAEDEQLALAAAVVEEAAPVTAAAEVNIYRKHTLSPIKEEISMEEAAAEEDGQETETNEITMNMGRRCAFSEQVCVCVSLVCSIRNSVYCTLQFNFSPAKEH